MTGSLPSVSGARVQRALAKAGWVVVRSKGGHISMSHQQRGGLVVVPMHGGKPVAPGTLRKILDQAGLTPEKFKELL